MKNAQHSGHGYFSVNFSHSSDKTGNIAHQSLGYSFLTQAHQKCQKHMTSWKPYSHPMVESLAHTPNGPKIVSRDQLKESFDVGEVLTTKAMRDGVVLNS